MKIEIDQSGKIEFTNKVTVVGYSNKDSKTIIILARQKQRLQKYFRKNKKPRQYIYATFAFLIFFLLKGKKNIGQIIIDTEYLGQEPLIKNYLINFFKKKKIKIDKRTFSFAQIGKKSKAHLVVYKAYRKKRADIKITADEIIKFLA